jgi:hypothetical protein
MEIIIAIAVFGFGLWWVFLRAPANTTPAAPYKVETPPTPEPVVEEVKNGFETVEGTITPVPVVATVVVESTESVNVTAPVKKPRKPRAPKAVAPVAKPAAKKAAPVKKAAAIKAAPKKPATPRSKKA